MKIYTLCKKPCFSPINQHFQIENNDTNNGQIVRFLHYSGGGKLILYL